MVVLPTLRVEVGAIPAGVLLPGDPGRAALIAEKLQKPKELGKNREFHTYCGLWQDVPVGVISTGVGAPGAAICAEEAIRGGAKVLIRVGTAGSLQEHVRDGDLVVVSAAARAEGTTPRLLPLEFPALADPEVVLTLHEEAEKLAPTVHRGVVVTLDAFYQGVLDLGLETYARCGALAVEMECSAIFAVAQLRKAQAGAILAIDGEARRAALGDYNPHREVVRRAVELEIEAALNALVRLLRKDHRRCL